MQIQTKNGEEFSLLDTIHVEASAQVHDGYHQLACAILYRAVRDLDSSNDLRAEKARQWLQSPYAAHLADMTGVVHPDRVMALATRH